MINRKLLFTLIVFLNILACNITKDRNLHHLLQKEINVDHFSYVLITTDFDCSSCIANLSKSESVNNQNTKGLYYSKHPKQLLVKLKKFFPKIKWQAINNKNILTVLKQQKEEGPYLLKIQNKKVILIQ